MRTLVFLSAVFCITVVLLAQSSSNSSFFSAPQNAAPVSQSDNQRRNDSQHSRSSDGVRMWRRAEIRVEPLEVVVANRAELESLRGRVARVDADSSILNASDPATREQLEKQLQLIKSLLNYAERAQSDAGKSPTALEVQRHLNEIEGKVSCEACHTGVVAELH